MKSPLINLGGELLEPEKAFVSVYDRSFLFGDSLYEVLRTYEGLPFELTSHLERLQKSADLCRFQEALPLLAYRTEILRTLKAFQDRAKDPKADAYIRIVVSRGVGKMGFALTNIRSGPHFVIYCEPIEPFVSADPNQGLKLRVVDRFRNDPRALAPAMKSGNYLNSLLAYLEAREVGADDAILPDSQGFITEGTTFNLFFVKDGIVITSPHEVGILDGISRRWILKICESLRIPTRIARFPKERLYDADEVFASSTLKEAFPVVSVDGNLIRGGKPGPLTLRIRARFLEEAVKHARQTGGTAASGS